jgi:type IV pilus assembly protein PilB
MGWMSSTQKLKLGELLIQAGLLSESQLRSALGEHRWWGHPLGVTLVRMGFVSEAALTRALASQLQLPIVTLSGKEIDLEVLELLPGDWALKNHVVPLFTREEAGQQTLFLGIGDPTDLEILEQVQALVGIPARAVVIAPSELEEALQRFYGAPKESPKPDALTEEPDILGASPANEAPAVSTSQLPSLSEANPVGLQPPSDPSAKQTRSVLKALAQLMIEKGLIEQRELNERVVAIQAEMKDDP